MKNSILLYLVILFVLTNIFTYMFLSKQVAFEQNNYDKLNKKYTDTIQKLNLKLQDANYFTLAYNQNAQDYFENPDGSYIDYQKIIPAVTESLKEFNTKPTGNIYTGQDPINGKKFIINKIQIVNNRWILADFNNGDYWGEALIKYFINADGTIDFQNFQSNLYVK